MPKFRPHVRAMQISCSSIAALLVALSLGLLSGCASSEETAGRQMLTANVGTYPPPPPGIAVRRLGVPEFQITGSNTEQQLARVAADQATTLMVNSGRFDVIERAQLDQLVKEQKLTGIVKADELAKSGEVRGVDYLLVGKVSNFRVKRQSTGRGFGLGKLLPYTGLTDFQKRDMSVTVEVGIDLRVVDTTSGSMLAAGTTDFTRTDKVSAFGLEILGVGAQADASVQLDEDNKGLVLRLAIDDAIKRMLPTIDNKLRGLQPAPATDGGNQHAGTYGRRDGNPGGYRKRPQEMRRNSARNAAPKSRPARSSAPTAASRSPSSVSRWSRPEPRGNAATHPRRRCSRPSPAMERAPRGRRSPP